MKSEKEIKAEYHAKAADIRNKREAAIEAAKNKAKTQVMSEKGKDPLVLGNIDLSDKDLTGVFSIEVRRDEGDGFKQGDIVARYSRPGYVEFAQPEIDKIESQAKADIEKLKQERDKALEVAFVEKNKERASQIEANLKKQEEALAKRKRLLAKLKGE